MLALGTFNFSYLYFIYLEFAVYHVWIISDKKTGSGALSWSSIGLFLLREQWEHLAPVPNIPCSRAKHSLLPCQTFLAPVPNIPCSCVKHPLFPCQTFLALVPNIPCSLYTITRAGLPKNFLFLLLSSLLTSPPGRG